MKYFALFYTLLFVSCSTTKPEEKLEMPTSVQFTMPGQKQSIVRIDSSKYANIMNGDTVGLYFLSDILIDSIQYRTGTLYFEYNEVGAPKEINYNSENESSQMDISETFIYQDGQLIENTVTISNKSRIEGIWSESDPQVQSRTITTAGDTISLINKNGFKSRTYIQDKLIPPLLFQWPYEMIYEGGDISYIRDQKGRITEVLRNGDSVIYLSYE